SHVRSGHQIQAVRCTPAVAGDGRMTSLRSPDIVAAVTLPWPSSDLSPNSRLHWARKSRVAKKARNDARLLCLAEGIRGLGWDRARVSVTFHAPDNRRRD